MKPPLGQGPDLPDTVKRFEIRTIGYGATIGPLLAAFATLAEAEAAHPADDPMQPLVIVGPDPLDRDKTCIYSRRVGGKWHRSAVLICESK
jgi:hypothetical protein